MASDLSPRTTGRAGTAPLYGAWAVLVAATIIVSLLRAGAAPTEVALTPIEVVVAIIAFAKIYLIMHVFMGVGSSPVALRLLSIAWVVVTCAAVCFFLAKNS